MMNHFSTICSEGAHAASTVYTWPNPNCC